MEMTDQVPAVAGQEDNGPLKDLAKRLAEGRADCIQAKADSGCEARWDQDEALYAGQDLPDQSDLRKPRATNAPVSFDEDRKTEERFGSTVFDNISKFYTDLTAARIGDMLCPIDERPFNIKPTPVPDIMEVAEDPTPLVDSGSSRRPWRRRWWTRPRRCR